MLTEIIFPVILIAICIMLILYFMMVFAATLVMHRVSKIAELLPLEWTKEEEIKKILKKNNQPGEVWVFAIPYDWEMVRDCYREIKSGSLILYVKFNLSDLLKIAEDTEGIEKRKESLESIVNEMKTFSVYIGKGPQSSKIEKPRALTLSEKSEQLADLKTLDKRIISRFYQTAYEYRRGRKPGNRKKRLPRIKQLHALTQQPLIA